MAWIKRETAIKIIEEKQKELCPVGKFGRHFIYGGDREKFDNFQEIIDSLESIPEENINFVHEAGGCYCGECYFGQKPTVKEMQEDYVYCKIQKVSKYKNGFCSYGIASGE